MSYDMGATWKVIHSHMGGCMSDSENLQVTIPSNAQNGEALFSWSWFNLLGNREMYQNCAVVTITGGGSGLTGPAPFVANAGVNDCKTIEGVNVVFPEPGDSVVYGGVYASSKPTTPAGFTGSSCGGSGATTGSGSSSSGSPAVAASSSAAAAPSVAAAINVEPASSSSAAAAAPTKVTCSRRRRRSHPRDLYNARLVQRS
jgi:hypothetical protein